MDFLCMVQGFVEIVAMGRMIWKIHWDAESYSWEAGVAWSNDEETMSRRLGGNDWLSESWTFSGFESQSWRIGF